MKYLKKFLTQAEYQAYRNSVDFVFPNASYIVEATDDGLKNKTNVTGTPTLNLKFELNPDEGMMGFYYPARSIKDIIVNGEKIEIEPEEYKTTETLLYNSEVTLDLETGLATFPDSYIITNNVDKVDLSLQDPNLKVNDITAFIVLGVMGGTSMCMPMPISSCVEQGLIELDVVNNVIRCTDALISEIKLAAAQGVSYSFLLGDFIGESDLAIYDTKRVEIGVIGGLPNPYMINDINEADVTLFLNTDHITKGWSFGGLNSMHGEHITTIENNSLEQQSIKEVSFTKHLKTIGDYAFQNCSGLTSVDIPNSVTSIGEYAFYYCRALTDLTIGSGVTSIGDSAFYGCSGLTSVIIGSGVTSIGQSAFRNCSGLTGITIPDSVTSISESAFGSCTGLTSVTIGSGVTAIGNYAFSGCSGLTGELVIPDSVTTIGTGAFNGCSGLTSLTLGSGVTSIGYGALPIVTLLVINCRCNAAPSIGSHSDSGCKGIVYIPEGSDYSSWKSTFSQWKFLNENSNDKYIVASYRSSSGTKQDLCNSTDWFDTMMINGSTYTNPVTEYTGTDVYLKVVYHLIKPEISDTAFYFADTMETIIIPDSVKTIGNEAFYRCENLKSINIPNSVKTIGKSAFNGCSGLTSIIIPNTVTTINESTFESCYKLKSVSLGSNVRTIKDYAFNNNTVLKSIDFPSTLKTIGRNAFWQTGLEDVRIPDSVTSIGTQCFAGSKSLKSITIGSRVTSIGETPFYFNKNLKEIICYAKKAPEAGGFIEVARNGILYVPKGSDYSSWMKNEENFLGYYGWTISYI